MKVPHYLLLLFACSCVVGNTNVNFNFGGLLADSLVAHSTPGHHPPSPTPLPCFDSPEARLREKHIASVKGVYDMAIFPNNYEIITTGVFPDVLAPNVNGRVYPFGYHNTPIGVAEYFYGLTPNNFTFDKMTVYIEDVIMSQFINQGLLAYSEISYVIRVIGTNITFLSPQRGTWRFGEDDLIVEFDTVQEFYSKQTRETTNYRDPIYRENIINQTCRDYERFCSGQYREYANEDACLAYLSAITFGEPDIFTANNTLCRNQHITLARLRPWIHCPHVGPTGGGFCVDESYDSLFVPLFPEAPNRLIGNSQNL